MVLLLPALALGLVIVGSILKSCSYVGLTKSLSDYLIGSLFYFSTKLDVIAYYNESLCPLDYFYYKSSNSFLVILLFHFFGS